MRSHLILLAKRRFRALRSEEGFSRFLFFDAGGVGRKPLRTRKEPGWVPVVPKRTTAGDLPIRLWLHWEEGSLAVASQFELVFNRFVESIGGEVVPESAAESADFVFRSERIVAELKTLERDPREEHVRKLAALAAGWHRRRQVPVYGTTVIDLRRTHPVAQREWLDLLEAPIEGIIRKANRQIRSTKDHEHLKDAKGLLLIVNDGNLLHTAPIVFMTLVARVLQKRSADGERKFRNIRGVVYFSYRVPAAGESNLFWIPGILEPAADADLGAFQDRLQREWFAYLARITGQPVTEDLRAIPR